MGYNLLKLHNKAMTLKSILHTTKFVAVTCLLLFELGSTKIIAQTAATTIPSKLQPDTNEVLVASYYAVGTQNYEAQADPKNPTQAKWVFIEPAANLYDKDGNVVILHSKGPIWECIADGSSVTGAVVTNVPAPVAAQNIPWLLLTNKANSGVGLLASVNFIQRLDTKGGLAPSQAPSPNMIGTIVKVPYSALYNFYKKK